MESGKVTGGIVEYDSETCDFVIAVGTVRLSEAPGSVRYEATTAESLSVAGTRWPTEDEKARFRGKPVSSSIGVFRAVSPFEKARMATTPSMPVGTSAMPNNCPTEFDGYKWAYNNTYFLEPANIRVNVDSTNGEWAYMDHVCIQQAIRQAWFKWFHYTGWYKVFGGWTGPFTIPPPYHSVEFESTATFANDVFCDSRPPGVWSEYPEVRILGHDDGHANFYDNAYSTGAFCYLFLTKLLDHYVSAG